MSEHCGKGLRTFSNNRSTILEITLERGGGGGGGGGGLNRFYEPPTLTLASIIIDVGRF